MNPPAINLGEAAPVWHAESLRLTAIWSLNTHVEVQQWWTELVGKDPETKSSRPKSGEYLDQGPYEGGNLILSVRPDRVDWQFAPAAQEEDPVGFPEVGPMATALNSFVPLMQRWLPTCPPISRLAFGAVLHLPAGSKEDGYQRISGYLPTVKLDAKGSSDLLYQINRPRKAVTQVPGLIVNRLTLWSVASVGRLRIVAGPQGAESWQGPQAYSCRLQLDINTSAEFKDNLPTQVLGQMFGELVQLAVEISGRGDVA